MSARCKKLLSFWPLASGPPSLGLSPLGSRLVALELRAPEHVFPMCLELGLLEESDAGCLPVVL